MTGALLSTDSSALHSVQHCVSNAQCAHHYSIPVEDLKSVDVHYCSALLWQSNGLLMNSNSRQSTHKLYSHLPLFFVGTALNYILRVNIISGIGL